tara:strand:- start:355 stop:684 length:330 start_codon:yes stop_codon:yes gene_type:complete
MNDLKKARVLQEVTMKLQEMGLGHYPVSIIPTERRRGEMNICVTHGPGAFGTQQETLNKYFDVKLFLWWFKTRKNYLKLTAAERAEITIHPEQWEREYLANNVQTITLD